MWTREKDKELSFYFIIFIIIFFPLLQSEIDRFFPHKHDGKIDNATTIVANNRERERETYTSDNFCLNKRL